MMQVIPWLLNWRRRSSKCSESASLSAAVGSSRIRSFTFLETALAISTSCCFPTPMRLTGVFGSSERPTLASNFCASRLVLFQSIRPRLLISLLRKMFSAIDRYGLSASSWWMITIPSSSLSRIFLSFNSCPSKIISPS